MVATEFLTIDDQSISLGQAIKYLQASGKLNNFLGDILREHLISQELKERSDIEVSQAVVEQAVINFRLQNKLSEPNQFQEWLNRTQTDYANFHNQVALTLILEQLKTKIAEPQLEEYFNQRRTFLDRVVLSRIIVDSYTQAESLQKQILEGASLGDLAREHSLATDRTVNGMMGAISVGTLPEVIRTAVEKANPREILGPLGVDGLWGLFRVEEFLPASLENQQLKQTLQNELFDKWLQEKLQTLTIKMNV